MAADGVIRSAWAAAAGASSGEAAPRGPLRGGRSAEAAAAGATPHGVASSRVASRLERQKKKTEDANPEKKTETETENQSKAGKGQRERQRQRKGAEDGRGAAGESKRGAPEQKGR